MSGQLPVFVLDANVFIQAHRRYYAFNICPGFWNCLLYYQKANRVLSIDRVRAEIVTGQKDTLEKWVKDSTSNEFFVSTKNSEIVTRFGEMMQWVQESSHYLNTAKKEFAHVADGWLVAYASNNSYTVVTEEEYNRDQKNRVPIPNLCEIFNVKYTNTFGMLANLGVKLTWN